MLGRKSEALALYDQLTVDNPTNAELLLEHGRVLQREGSPDAALERFGRAIDVARYAGSLAVRVRAHIWKGALLLERGDAEAALSSLEKAIALPTDSPSDEVASLLGFARYLVGTARVTLRRYDEALAELASVPNEPAAISLYALAMRVQVHRALGQYHEAWRLLAVAEPIGDRALEQKPLDHVDTDVVRNYGEVLRLLGDPAKAAELYRRGIAADPEDTYLRVQLIATYLELADEAGTAPGGAVERARCLQLARHEFGRTEALHRRRLEDKRSTRNLVAFGSLCMLMGHDDAATPLLEEAIELGRKMSVAGPEQEIAHAQLARAATRRDDHAAAALEFEAALAYDAEDLHHRSGFAEAYLRLGRLQEAGERYRSILDAAPGSIEARIGLAEVLLAQAENDRPENYELAIAEYGEAIRLADNVLRAPPKLREGSTRLSPRKLATLHYQVAFAYTKLFNADIARGTLGVQGPGHIAKAVKAFRQARDTDPTYLQPRAALERVSREQRERRQRRMLETVAPVVLGIVCLVLLVLLHLGYFVGPVRHALPATFQAKLTPTSYTLLLFGLLILLVAVISLPQLLKLKLGGVSLEKAPLEHATPLELSIPVDQFGALVVMKPTLAVDTERVALDRSEAAGRRTSTSRFEPPGGEGTAGFEHAAEAPEEKIRGDGRPPVDGDGEPG